VVSCAVQVADHGRGGADIGGIVGLNRGFESLVRGFEVRLHGNVIIGQGRKDGKRSRLLARIETQEVRQCLDAALGDLSRRWGSAGRCLSERRLGECDCSDETRINRGRKCASCHS